MGSLFIRNKTASDPHPAFINPWREVNAGLWSLFAGATILLAARIWTKTTRRNGLWYDDWILIASWALLLANNIVIIVELKTGYVLKDNTHHWDDRMHILINISSCGTLIGQSLTKTAFGVTLLRMSKRWQKAIIWYCIVTMNLWMMAKVLLTWAKVCRVPSYQNWYRLNFCIWPTFRDRFKVGANVYNVLMDFIFACIPWFITRHLDMQRLEKIGLTLTMSLGMVVAIVAAIRISWKEDGNSHDAYYIWRNGISHVWYASEVAGTIMVQCIPVLRPMLREIQTSMSSRKLNTGGSGYPDGKNSSMWSSKLSGKRLSGAGTQPQINNNNNNNNRISLSSAVHGHKLDHCNAPPRYDRPDHTALLQIPEEPPEESETENEIWCGPPPHSSHSSPAWPLADLEAASSYRRSGLAYSGRTFLDFEERSIDTYEEEQPGHGLSPPPPPRK